MTRSAQERIADVLDAVENCERYRRRFTDPDAEVVEMAFQAAIVTTTLDRDLAPLAAAPRTHRGD